MFQKFLGELRARSLSVLWSGLLATLLLSSSAYAVDKKLQKSFDDLKASKLDPMQAAAAFEKTIDPNVDVAEAALLIERQIDSKIDVKKYLNQLDKMVSEVKARTAGRTDPRQRMHVLRHYLFSIFGMRYDYSDPFAEKRSNFTLSGILSTKKGSCVTMPLLFLVMSQRLGYPVSAVLLPQHMFLRYSAIPTAEFDMEVTSDGDIFRESGFYAREKDSGVTERGIKSGSYMKALTKKETLAALLSYSAQHFFYKKKDYDRGFRYINAAIKLHENSANLYLAKAQFFNHMRKLAQADRNLQWEQTYYQFAQSYADKANELGYTRPDEKWKNNYKQSISELKKQEELNDGKKVLSMFQGGMQ